MKDYDYMFWLWIELQIDWTLNEIQLLLGKVNYAKVKASQY